MPKNTHFYQNLFQKFDYFQSFFEGWGVKNFHIFPKFTIIIRVLPFLNWEGFPMQKYWICWKIVSDFGQTFLTNIFWLNIFVYFMTKHFRDQNFSLKFFSCVKNYCWTKYIWSKIIFTLNLFQEPSSFQHNKPRENFPYLSIFRHSYDLPNFDPPFFLKIYQGRLGNSLNCGWVLLWL